MELIDHLALGFQVALTWHNVLYAFVGCLMGTLIGILPGLGPLATISMLLPFTYSLEPTSALIMLAGIYYGAQYGGSTTAILVNLRRIFLRRHSFRRIPYGAQWPSRYGVSHGRAGFLFCWNGGHFAARRFSRPP